jgi:hypothetical protein
MTNSLQRFDPFNYISSLGYITILTIALWSYAFAFSWFLPLALGDCSVAFCALCAVPTSIIVSFLASLSIAAFRKRSRSALRPTARLPLSKKFFAAVFVSLVCVWLIAFLILYPGCASVDSDDILKMVLGFPFESSHFRYAGLNSHHPVAYTLFVDVFLSLGQAVGMTVTESVALVAVAQLLLFALCCAWFTMRLYSFSSSKLLLAISWGYFLLNPLLPWYAVTLWKDILFSGFFLVFCVEIAGITVFETCGARRANRRTRSAEPAPSMKAARPTRTTTAALIVSGLFCCLLRSNGTMIVSLTLLILIIACNRLRRYLMYLVLATVLPALLITGPLCSALGIQKAHFAEAVSIPLQQMARVVADDGTISEADTELLNTILPLEQVKECYDETTPNAVKFAPDFNDAYLESHKDEFFNAWLRTGLANPSTYLRAWIAQTATFWCVDETTWYLSAPGYSLDPYLTDDDVIVNRSNNHLAGVVSIENFRAVTLQAVQALGPLFNSGFLAWFLLYALLVALCTKDKRMVLALVPALALWGCFLLAAPSDDFRYMLGIHLMVPLLIAFLTVAGNGGQAVRTEKPQATGHISRPWRKRI